MDSDLILVLGLVVALLAVPSAVSAYSDGRPPLLPGIAFLIGAGLVAAMVVMNPGVYSVATLPDVFFGVIGRYMP